MDRYCDTNTIDHVDLLKIDVQGAEDRVLAGAAKMLPRIDIIQLEITFFSFYENCSGGNDIESLISPFDFTLFTINRVCLVPRTDRIHFLEAFYVRDQ